MTSLTLKRLCCVGCLLGVILMLTSRSFLQSSFGWAVGGDECITELTPSAKPSQKLDGPSDPITQEDDTKLLSDGAILARPSVLLVNSTRKDGCDIFKGQWIPDPIGPLYSFNTCRQVLTSTQAQNCRDNGRPDNKYEYYKWKPHGCEIPRLDPLAFLELMKGKTMAVIGDSLARNQYESLICNLLQAEDGELRASRTMQRWYFGTHNFTLIRIWSTFLVQQSNETFPFAPDDSVKLFLDKADNFTQFIPEFDVVIISSGHWWERKTTYIVDGKIQGGYKWTPNVTKVDHNRAFSMAVGTALKVIGEIPNYHGLTILKPFSPNHYEGGLWDTGGSCTGKTEPYLPGQAPKNAFNEMMREKQLDALELTVQRLNGSKKRNGSKYAVLDIFEAMNYRGDGHPGPYRSKDPNKRTQRDAKGPPPQDCLHWCMPGPVDTINQLLFELLKTHLPQ
ncbi:hypothetical protein R1flu_020839 [Riccia fluitans]|uniref:Trichome birefringence-like N-terminal domain-containing protein n=1 Tax=Riccia fluitans TaxID=41844 RepID=A0ABD1ZMN3_9MARC